MTNSSIKSQLQQAIQSVSSKGAEVEKGTFNEATSADRAAQAQNIISAKTSALNAREKELDNIMQQLSPPPTKEVSGEGKNGGTKTVVDQEEVNRLNGQKAATQSQIQLAKTEVADAKDEAEAASATALEAAGVSRDNQSQMQSLLERVGNIQDSLKAGEKVPDQDIEKVITDYNTLAGDLTKSDNKGGAITKAFYNPLKQGLKAILDLVKNPPAAQAQGSTEATGTNGTANTTGTAATESTTATGGTATTTGSTETSTGDAGATADSEQQVAATAGAAG